MEFVIRRSFGLLRGAKKLYIFKKQRGKAPKGDTKFFFLLVLQWDFLDAFDYKIKGGLGFYFLEAGVNNLFDL